MKKTNIAIALLSAIGLSAVATPAMAYEAGDWLVRGRVINVNPNDSSGPLYVNGSKLAKGVTVDSDTVPELDITYMISKNWGTELILGYSKHTVTGDRTVGAALGSGNARDVIDTKVLPPTLTLQYHFMPDSKFRPYVGAGINYTKFFDESVPHSSALYQSGAKVKMDSSWGLAAQAGVDIALNSDWFMNLDVKYIDMSTTARFKNTTLGNLRIDANVNPIVWGIGIGRRF